MLERRSLSLFSLHLFARLLVCMRSKSQSSRIGLKSSHHEKPAAGNPRRGFSLILRTLYLQTARAVHCAC